METVLPIRVKYLNNDRFILDGIKKNALKIGTIGIGGTKFNYYIVTLEINDNGEEIMRIHTFINDYSNDKNIEYCPKECVKDMFRRMTFF